MVNTKRLEKMSWIELLRFVACLAVMGIYSYLLGGEKYPFYGAICWVDFFFILSGYFSAKHHSECKNSSPIIYTFEKFSKFLPYVFVGTVLATIVFIVQYNLNTKESIKLILYWPIQFMCLSLTGVMPGGNVETGSIVISDSFTVPLVYDTPLWYLSALLIALPLVLYIESICKNHFRYYILIYGPLLLYGILIKNGNSIVEWYYEYNGVIRATGGLLSGLLVFEFSEIIKKFWRLNNKRKIIVTVAECLGWLLIIGLSSITSTLYFSVEIIAMIILLSVSFGGISYTSSIHSKALNHLGKLSLPIYCIHYPIFNFVGTFLEGDWKFKMIISILITVIVSESVLFFERLGRSKFVKNNSLNMNMH